MLDVVLIMLLIVVVVFGSNKSSSRLSNVMGRLCVLSFVRSRCSAE